jgi:flagellar hook-associated protein 3 FlgL
MRLSRIISEMKARAQQARTEAVTGRYEDATKAAGGDIGGVHLLQKAVDDAKVYQTTLSLAEIRATRTQTVLGGLTSESTRLGTAAIAALGQADEATMKTLAKDARETLQTIFAGLNTSDGGRALFSGDALDRPALGSVDQLLTDVQAIIAGATDAAAAETALDTYFNDAAGGFSTTIYQGGTGDAPAVEIAPGVRVNASVKANAQPIKDLIRGLAVMANYDAAPGGLAAERDIVARSAAEFTLVAEDDVVNLRATLGIAEQRIARSKERYEAEETVLTGLLNKKTARDPYEAAAELQLLESQLEASYVMTARLSRLTISQYLR